MVAVDCISSSSSGDKKPLAWKKKRKTARKINADRPIQRDTEEMQGRKKKGGGREKPGKEEKGAARESAVLGSSC